MTGLKRLAKLRQYGGDKDLSEWMQTEHRQNMLAIENSLDDLSSEEVGCILNFGSLSIGNDLSSQLIISDKVKDPYSLVSDNKIIIKDQGKYILDFSIINYVCIAQRALYLELYKNGSLESRTAIIYSDGTTTLKGSCSFDLLRDLSVKDEITINILNDGLVSSSTATVDSVLLKMNKLET